MKPSKPEYPAWVFLLIRLASIIFAAFVLWLVLW